MDKLTYFLIITLLYCVIPASAARAEDAADFSGLTLVQLYNNEALKKIAVEKGGAAYKQHCAQCHGVDGTGKT
ncbi:MAG: Cbb3-type cytochrome c oxidase subunit, partial [Gammaproteobacteria bacterium]|nr:Cbb3-type cytochrome c oxidase subunit [Gammaproteobacteria bacterium]